MKKWISLMIISTFLCSIPVMAAENSSEPAVVSSSNAEEGFITDSDAQAAAVRGMSAGEYYNNTVSSVKGLSNAIPIGQGGKIVINGVATNLTATLSKVNDAEISNAKGQAAFFGGRLFNILRADIPGVKFHMANVNFYVKGLAAGTHVVVRQLVNGGWIDVGVTELRADHIVLNLNNSGPIAFIEIPAPAVNP